METITSLLTEDHRHADALFAATLQHASSGAWTRCRQQLAEFRAALQTHMRIEEDLLFPAFEDATGMRDTGPTAVMRHEHVEMLQALTALAAAIAAADGKAFQSQAEAFLDTLDTHSMKEENVLYPMCDRLVGTLDAAQLRQTLQELRSTPAT